MPRGKRETRTAVHKKGTTKPVGKAAHEPVGLPNYFAAVWTACRCFAIEVAKLEYSLKCLRSGAPDPDKHFPRRLTRVMLDRADAGSGKWIPGLGEIGFHALYDRILREDKSNRSSVSAHFSQDLVRTLLFLYERISPKLRIDGVPRRQAMDLLIRELFVPTVYVLLAKKWHSACHGNEFHPDTCWYLPRVVSGQLEAPFPRMLRIWMKCAGFRYASDIGKQASEAEGRKVENWLKGKNLPKPQAIRRMIDRFPGEAEEIDTPESWKGRLILASAMQRLCAMLDSYYAGSQPRASLRFTEALRRIREEGIAIDSRNLLFQTNTFFAARLLQRRWQNSGEWESKVLPRGQPMPSQPDPTASDEAYESFQEECHWKSNPGNLCIEHIQDTVDARAREQLPEGGYNLTLEEAIFDLGIAELNLLLDAKRGPVSTEPTGPHN